MNDILLKMMFEHKRWQDMIDRANEKEIDLTVLKQLCDPKVRVQLYNAIKSFNYLIVPPHIARIPKDNGDYREVYVNEAVDRIVLTLINDCLNELFGDMIHPCSKAYQKGIGSQEVVLMASKEICKKNNIKNDNINNGDTFIGYKADLSKYFDSVKIEIIDSIFDEWESRLGFEIGTEPVIAILRKYYHNDFVFDINKNLIKHYGSLKQGCSVAAILANVVLYEVDNVLSKMNILYIRYSDDILMIGEDAELAKQTLESMLVNYGLSLNPKKVEKLYSDQWFKFLGFNIKGDQITLSKNRINNLMEEIFNKTIAKPWITPWQAKKNIKDYLYGSGEGYSWATSAFNALQNCETDIVILNNWIMDCIRLCEIRHEYNKKRRKDGKKSKEIIYHWDDIGGIGVVTNLPDRTMIRGKGSKIKTAKERTQKEIEYYYSIGCLLNCYKMGKPIYEACVRGM